MSIVEQMVYRYLLLSLSLCISRRRREMLRDRPVCFPVCLSGAWPLFQSANGDEKYHVLLSFVFLIRDNDFMFSSH